MMFELKNFGKNEYCILHATQILNLSQAIEYEKWELTIRADNS